MGGRRSWGFPSYRRNQQPNQPGRTLRVGRSSAQAGNELDYAREAKEKGVARSGSLCMHWRRYSHDWNNGECRRCFYQQGRTSADPRCNVCYGTGWHGGYSRPSVQWMIINDAETVFRIADTGVLRIREADSYSPAVPRISPSDVIAQIDISNGKPVTGDRYLVGSRVREERMRDQIDSLRVGTDDHLDHEPEVIGYTFQTNLIPIDPDEDFLRPEYRIPPDNPIWLANPAELVALTGTPQ